MPRHTHLIGLLLLSLLAAAPVPSEKSDWHGYERHDSALADFRYTIISPKRTAPGKPWIWRARFLDHRPDVDLALLEEGFHVVHLDDTTEKLGSPEALRQWDILYKHLTEERGFAKKMALEGISRGGLYIYNWAAANPDKVACLFGDCPVLDLKSWPAGKGTSKGSPSTWKLAMKSYGFATEQEALAWPKNPVDNLKPIVAAKIPILHVCGDADEPVPMAENTLLFKQRLEALGGSMQLIVKPGIGHEHGLPDSTPIVRFILQHAAPAGSAPILKDIGRIVVLGDSITHGGQYIEYLDAYLFTRLPDRRFELIGLGLSSETTSGLSEDGHAGGKFPRPCLHERLSRVLAQSKPDLVVACYGINDGIYMPFDAQRFAAYQQGITRLVTEAGAAGAQVLLMTPPVFDPTPVKKLTDDGIGGMYRDYDNVLGRSAAWLLEQRSAGWTVADVHGPMARHLAERRTQDPDYLLAKDGVHASPFGHWIMAQAVLDAWDAPAEVDCAIVDLTGRRAARGHITDIKRDGETVSFTWRTRRPMPMDTRWDSKSVELERVVQRVNRQRLSVTGLPAGRHQLFEGDAPVGIFTREQFAAGLDVLTLPQLSVNRDSDKLLKLIAQRQGILKAAWLTDVGHTRPGVAPGLPLAEAQARAAELENQIRTLAAPVSMNLRLAPVK